jgi:hypothetical protein
MQAILMSSASFISLTVAFVRDLEVDGWVGGGSVGSRMSTLL